MLNALSAVGHLDEAKLIAAWAMPCPGTSPSWEALLRSLLASLSEAKRSAANGGALCEKLRSRSRCFQKPRQQRCARASMWLSTRLSGLGGNCGLKLRSSLQCTGPSAARREQRKTSGKHSPSKGRLRRPQPADVEAVTCTQTGFPLS